MNELIDKIIKEMDNFNFNDEQKEYYLFVFFKTIKDINKRDEVQKLLREKNIASSKAYLMATIFGVDNDYTKFITEINKLKLIDDNYKNILSKTKLLSEELNLKNSLEIANLYTYLLWNGYFSKDFELKFQSFKRNMINAHYSFDIMSGIGVCLNFSDMLTDLINLYDYSAASVINKFDVKQKRYYVPDIERKIAKVNIGNKIKASIFKPLANMTGNHAFTLIVDKEKMYIYDPTNFMIFNIDSRFKCTNICGTRGCELKPIFSHFINNSEKANFALGALNLNNSYESPYTRKDFIFTFENCVDTLNDKKSLLNSFHQEILNNIKVIDENSKDVKKLIKEKKKEYKNLNKKTNY